MSHRWYAFRYNWSSYYPVFSPLHLGYTSDATPQAIIGIKLPINALHVNPLSAYRPCYTLEKKKWGGRGEGQACDTEQITFVTIVLYARVREVCNGPSASQAGSATFDWLMPSGSPRYTKRKKLDCRGSRTQLPLWPKVP